MIAVTAGGDGEEDQGIAEIAAIERPNTKGTKVSTRGTKGTAGIGGSPRSPESQQSKDSPASGGHSASAEARGGFLFGSENVDHGHQPGDLEQVVHLGRRIADLDVPTEAPGREHQPDQSS